MTATPRHVPTAQERITNLEALLKFADARINLLAGQAEGAQSGGQADDSEAAAFERLICPRHAARGQSGELEFLHEFGDAIREAWLAGIGYGAKRAAAPALEVTPAMVAAASEAYCPFGDMELAIRAALLAASQPNGEAAHG